MQASASASCSKTAHSYQKLTFKQVTRDLRINEPQESVKMGCLRR